MKRSSSRKLVLTVLAAAYFFSVFGKEVCFAREITDGTYADKQLGFSVRLPQGWIQRPKYLRGNVSLELNCTRTGHEFFPWLAIVAVDTGEPGGGNGDAGGILLYNTEKFMEQRIVLERAGGGTVSVYQKPVLAAAGQHTAGTFALQCDSVSVIPGQPLNQHDILLIGYVFLLPDKGKILSFCFYAHDDARFAAEREYLRNVLDSLEFLPAGEGK